MRCLSCTEWSSLLGANYDQADVQLRSPFPRRIGPGDVTVDGGAAETMLLAAAAGLAAGVEAGNDLAPAVDDLRLPVDPQTAERIEHRRSVPRRRRRAGC